MRRILVGAIGLGLALSALAPSTPAHAAGSIGISDDGVTYGSAFPGTLFDETWVLVPLDSESESFYVRNDTSEPAFLRITLRDVSYSDPAYGAALTVSASTLTAIGSPRALSAATPCAILVEGQTVQPGEVVPITAVLELGDLTGSAGQNATADFTMRVELHDTSTGALPAAACSTPTGTPSTDVVVVPPSRPQGGYGRTGGTPTTVVPETGTETETPDDADPEELPGVNQSNIEPNTFLYFEERWWFAFLAAFAVGTLCFMIVDWVRRRRALEDETETGA
jgi:hypothetical protein